MSLTCIALHASPLVDDRTANMVYATTKSIAPQSVPKKTVTTDLESCVDKLKGH